MGACEWPVGRKWCYHNTVNIVMFDCLENLFVCFWLVLGLYFLLHVVFKFPLCKKNLFFKCSYHEKISCPSHNALLPIWFFVQVVMLFPMTTCTKTLTGNNALWDGHDTLSSSYHTPAKWLHTHPHNLWVYRHPLHRCVFTILLY